MSLTDLEHAEHGLRDIEGVSPVVVRHVAVVLLHAQQKPTQQLERKQDHFTVQFQKVLVIYLLKTYSAVNCTGSPQGFS